MKRIPAILVCALMLLASLSSAFAKPAGQAEALTLMVYMCGSNLESGYGSATRDLREMIASGFDESEINVLVMAGGTSEWEIGFDPDMLTISEIGRRGMRTVRQVPAQSMGAPETLTALLDFGAENYPAREYALILWNHGGGPIEGACWDELFSMDGLSLPELTRGIEASKLPKKLNWIGFDACLMGSAEVAAKLSPYAGYMIASEETEPATGWDYGFLSGLAANATGADAGRLIIDSYFESLSDAGDTLTLSCTDLGGIADLRAALDAFFDPIAGTLGPDSFTRLSGNLLGATGFGKALRGASDSSYDLIDLNDLVSRYADGESETEVSDALGRAVVYSRASVAGAAGLSVYHPYANKTKYLESWSADYEQLGFCPGYTRYVNRFGALLTADERVDWTALAARDEGFGAGLENVFSLQLTPEQAESFAEAQLLILAERSSTELFRGLVGGGDPAPGKTYSPVSVSEAGIDENGLVTARYAGRTLYVTDAEGRPLLGPLAYSMSDDGQTYTVHALYNDESGREDSAPSIQVLFNSRLGADDTLEIVTTQAYDGASGTFTNRIPVYEGEYTNLLFYPELHTMPEYGDILPGFDDWDTVLSVWGDGIRLPYDWRLRFFDVQLSSAQLYATFQVTDVQQNRFCSPLIPVANPNLEDVRVIPRTVAEEDFELELYVTRDASPLDPGVNLSVKVTDRSPLAGEFRFSNIVANGTRTLLNTYDAYTPLQVKDVQPNGTRTDTCHIKAVNLIGLDELTSLSLTFEFRPDLTSDAVYSRTLKFDIENCPLTDIAPPVSGAIGSAVENGITWSVHEPGRNQQGNLTCLVHIENDTAQALEHSGSAMVNGINTSGRFNAMASPHTDAWCALEIEDRVRLMNTRIQADGHSLFYSLASDALLEMYGVRDVTELTLLSSYGYDIDSAVTVGIGAGWHISDAPSAEPPARKPLLEGNVSVDVERALLADNAVGLRLAIRNDTDRPRTLLIGGQTINGRPASNPYPEPVSLPARSLTVYCTAVEGIGVVAEGERIAQAALRFRLDDLTSEEVPISFEPIPGGGRYLSTDEIVTSPVRIDRPAFNVLNAVETDRYRMELEAVLTNKGPDIIEYFTNLEDMLTLRLTVTNKTSQTQNYAFEDAVLNGTRALGEHWLPWDVGPSETVTDEISVPMRALTGITALENVSATLNVYGPSDDPERTESEVRFDLSGSLGGFAPPAPEALAEGASGGLDARLCSIGQALSGDIEMLLYLRNDGERGKYAIYTQIEDVAGSDYAYIDLAPGLDRYITLVWDDSVTIPLNELDTLTGNGTSATAVDRLLERHGVREISRVRLCANVDTDPLSIDLTLPEPFPLDHADPLETLPLLNGGDCAVSAVSVVVGRESLAVVLAVTNLSDARVFLRLDEPRVNGEEAGFFGDWAEDGRAFMIDSHTVWPIEAGGTSYVYVPVKTPVGEAIRQISLRAGTEDHTLGVIGIDIDGEAKTGLAGGVWLLPGDLSTAWDPGAALIDRSPDITGLERAEAVRLVPELDAETAARVAGGTINVVLDTGDEKRLLLGADLETDEAGGLYADCPGLTLITDSGTPLYSRLFHFDDGSYEFDMFYYLFGPEGRPEPGLDLAASEPDYAVYGMVYYDLAPGASQASFFGFLYDSEGNALDGSNVTLGAAGCLMWPQVSGIDEDGNITAWDSLVWPGWKPLETRIVPIRDLDGEVWVLYSLELDDGTPLSFRGEWPG